MEAKFCTIFFAILLCFNLTISQEMKSDKGDWIFSSQIGFASLEAENQIKATATAIENSIGKEINIGELASIVICIEHLSLSSDYNDRNGNQLFLNNNYLTIPISYQLAYHNNQPISFLSGIGLYASFLFRSKIENVLANTIIKQNGLGLNYGLQLYFDTRFKLNESLAIIIGIKTKSDAFETYKGSVRNYKITNFYALRFGLKLCP